MTSEEYAEQIAQMSKTMFAYCLSRTNSYHDAEDLAQEILLISCRSGNCFPNEKAFYAFVWRTAENILNSWYRSKDRCNTAALDETFPDNQWEYLEEQAQENEQLMLIARELALLNSNYRHVMVAHYIDGLSVKDISARFSLSQSMVKYLLFQSRKRIKEGITMERNFGTYSYNPVKLDWRWAHAPVKDYRRFHFSSIQQNILMACYYDKQNEEQLSLQLGVPTAYLEGEIQNLIDFELLSEKNSFYLSNVMIHTKKAMQARFQAKETELKETAEKIKAFFDSHAEEIRAIGFYGSDMSVNSLKWFVFTRILRCADYCLWNALPKSKHDPKECPYVRIFLIECEEAPKGNNYDPLMATQETSNGSVVFHWIRFNSPVFQKLSDVQANMLTMLTCAQPETEHDKMICTELIDMGCAVRVGDEIKPNYPWFTEEQIWKLNGLLDPFMQEEIYSKALERVELTRKITREHTPDRFQQYADDMILLSMGEEMSDLTRLLVEDGWLVQWTGMNPTNIIYTK